jgi:hypothetical protein
MCFRIPGAGVGQSTLANFAAITCVPPSHAIRHRLRAGGWQREGERPQADLVESVLGLLERRQDPRVVVGQHFKRSLNIGQALLNQ